ncbi:MAG: alcohol dehydrogenase catalytic domain-containing protein [Clostridiales bacterium]|nr:alcohol dehydrogenase catalytic domain-containing protein [Clostridiales bacterium]
MINTVYRLIAPRLIDVAYKEIEVDKDSLIIRPLYLSICKADQRYYQGMRSQAVLREKLPMAMIHECVAQVIYDKSGRFSVGDTVIPIPNIPVEDDGYTAENYLRSSRFMSSGYDGFLQDYIVMPADRIVPAPEGVSLKVLSFTELISVSVHAITRFERFAAGSRIESIGVWGDGNLGFITALLLHYLYPEVKLRVFGTVYEKLSYFTFADEVYHVDDIGNVKVDHGFECVGGAGSRPAINQIIDCINPEGRISIMGVSENFVDINTRMMLEKGLCMFGSSRSGLEDFKRTVEILKKYPEIVQYYENLVGDVVEVKKISDIHKAFELDIKRNFGKTVLKWEK